MARAPDTLRAHVLDAVGIDMLEGFGSSGAFRPGKSGTKLRAWLEIMAAGVRTSRSVLRCNLQTSMIMAIGLHLQIESDYHRPPGRCTPCRMPAFRKEVPTSVSDSSGKGRSLCKQISVPRIATASTLPIRLALTLATRQVTIPGRCPREFRTAVWTDRLRRITAALSLMSKQVAECRKFSTITAVLETLGLGPGC